PPVSTITKRLPAHSQTSSFRSRVTPGVSWTTADLVDVSRLTSVDFPTFGKPTTATLPSRPSMASSVGALANELLDAGDNAFHLELRGVYLACVRSRLHTLGVRRIPLEQVGRERVGADLRTLRLAAAGSDLGIGGEVDLDLGVGHDDG